MAQVQNKYGAQRGDYVMCDSTNTRCIDARVSSSCYTRFINDPFGTRRRANARFEEAPDSDDDPAGRLSTQCVALRAIRPGEEILAEYKGDYFEEEDLVELGPEEFVPVVDLDDFDLRRE